MPKHLECVVPNCEFAVTAATEREILEVVKLHASHTHSLSTIPPELSEQVKAAITDRPASR
jgi:predicted small metal-binding protein